MTDKKSPISRRSFIAGGATGVAAGAATSALGQEFISLGNLDDLPDRWWEVDLPPAPPVIPDPPFVPDPPVIGDCPPVIDTGGGDGGFGDTPGIAVRRNVFSLAANGPEMSALRRGIEVMRSRPATDPTSYEYQARIHGIERGGAPAPFGAPWGTCRHVSNDFLTWHRLYLHFFERIVREASGDPSFALPYWDYSVPGQNALPPAFRQQFANPLFEVRRNANINAGGTINPLVASSAQAMQTTRFPRPFFSAALENQPHNVIHVEIGGAMGDPATAGEDPIFWLHHANIDRLWSRWVASGNGRSNPTDPATLNAPFPFADERGQIVTARGIDALDTQNQLGYRYDDDPATPAGADPGAVATVLVARAPVTRAARVVTGAPQPQAAFSAAPAPFQVAESTLADGGRVRLGGRATGVMLSPMQEAQPAFRTAPAPQPSFSLRSDGTIAPAPLRQAPAFAAPPAPAASMEVFRSDMANDEPVLLQLENIDFDTPPGVWYAIYVNAPAGTVPDPRGPYFAGIFAPFAQNTSDEPTVFDITGLLNRQIESGLFGGGEIEVDFVPNRDDANVPPIDIGRVRIVRP